MRKGQTYPLNTQDGVPSVFPLQPEPDSDSDRDSDSERPRGCFAQWATTQAEQESKFPTISLLPFH